MEIINNIKQKDLYINNYKTVCSHCSQHINIYNYRWIDGSISDFSYKCPYCKHVITQKNNIEIYNEKIAIAVATESMPQLERATIAKVSDELISITDVEMGVTIGYIGENEIGLSARSLGGINCQIVMEKMGGGGHLNNAAAQIKNSTVKEVYNKLLDTLEKYVEEDTNMKVILTKDHKKYGKKDD